MCYFISLVFVIDLSFHGKKGGICMYLMENTWWIYAKCGICLHLLVFTDGKIQGFPIVLLWGNLSIRSLSGIFPLRWIPENACCLHGIYRSVNTWRMHMPCLFACVHRSFPGVKLHFTWGLQLKTGIYPYFPERQMPLNFAKHTVFQNSPLSYVRKA